MTRIKRGVAAHKKHKKLLNAAEAADRLAVADDRLREARADPA